MILIISFLIILFIFFTLSNNNHEEFINYNQCGKDINPSLNNRIKKAFNNDYVYDTKKWNLYMPCGYTYAENELKKIKFSNNNQILFAIDGCDNLASKISLANLLKKKYGNNYSLYIPKSYSNNKKELISLLNNHKPGIKYIAKRDIQQQKGLEIIHDSEKIKNILNDKSYIVIQELLNNPFLVNNRKINIRIYFLITCFKGKIKAYIHNNGFMYYTPKYFNYNSKDKDAHITTGYISRGVYANNPLTLEDFYKYLDNKGYNSNNLKNNIKDLFKKVMNAVNPGVCNKSLSNNNLIFQLFGTDIAPDNNLNVKLIEINKGPDMGGKDTRDNQVKDKVIKDVFKTIGIIENTDNGYTNVW